jgi:hypothetical protein
MRASALRLRPARAATCQSCSTRAPASTPRGASTRPDGPRWSGA